MSATAPLLEVQDLKKYYPVRGGVMARRQGEVRAVDGVSFTLAAGQTLGLVGESGCGKSTLGRTLMRLEEPSGGRVLFEGADIASASRAQLFQMRRQMQMVFQDPYSSLNPRMTVGEIVREPLAVHGLGSRTEQKDKVAELLDLVGMGAGDVPGRYPHEFSGGQRQRIGIARALTLGPKLLVADEPVSALDVSVQSQVLNLLVDLQRRLHLTLIFISHDLSVVEYISDVIAVMYLGRIVEIGPACRVFEAPAHPYTRALLASAPVADPSQRATTPPLAGETPSPIAPPPGCAFHPRCRWAQPACSQSLPCLEPAGESSAHQVACLRHREI